MAGVCNGRLPILPRPWTVIHRLAPTSCNLHLIRGSTVSSFAAKETNNLAAQFPNGTGQLLVRAAEHLASVVGHGKIITGRVVASTPWCDPVDPTALNIAGAMAANGRIVPVR